MRLADSGVGPDGIPYSAFRAFFVPKKPDPASPSKVVTAAPDTRPLGLQNSDAKILSSAVLAVVAP
eukprot:7456038-Karenia_brevis.AAC.1